MTIKNLIVRPTTKAVDSGDRLFTTLVGAASSIVVILLLGFIILLVVDSRESIRSF